MPRFSAKVNTALLRGFVDQIKADLRGEVLASSVMAGAQVILNEAKINCPVDTGNLRRSLHAEYGEATPTTASVEVGTDVEYAAAVEYGHMTRPALKHPEKQLPGRPRLVPAQPYLRPAVDEHGHEAAQEMVDTFRELAFEELSSLGPRGGTRK